MRFAQSVTIMADLVPVMTDLRRFSHPPRYMVMAGPVPAIHATSVMVADGRDKPGHDGSGDWMTTACVGMTVGCPAGASHPPCSPPMGPSPTMTGATRA